MTWFIRHPSDETLVSLTRDALNDDARSTVRAHLADCVRCRDALRAFMSLRESKTSTPVVARSAIFDRVLASRAAGERYIAPSTTLTQRPRRRRRPLVVTIAAAAAMIVVGLVALRPRNVSAVDNNSLLELLPAKPHLGDTIHVVYRPMAGMFTNDASLTLRASFRVPHDDSYPGAVPRARIRPAAQLVRTSGNEYRATFVLPDSVVYASLVVEDANATRIDKNAGHAWELMVFDASGKPSFEALDQRTNQMMGQSWEEGAATAKRLTELHPDRVVSWTWKRNFDIWLLGAASADSIAKAYGDHLDKVIELEKTQPHLTERDAGSIFFETWNRARNGTATDSARFRYWFERLSREYPRHSQFQQYYAFTFPPSEYKKPTFILDSLEKLFNALQPISGPGRSLLHFGLDAAIKMNDDSAFARWTYRAYAKNPEGLALALAERPSFRPVAMASLRGLLQANNDSSVSRRELTETRAEYRRRVDEGRRKLLIALGQALIAEGQVPAALDTLNRAAQGTWNLALFRSLRSAYHSASDSNAVTEMNARISVDPRTTPDSASALMLAGRAQVGAAKWDSMVSAARREMDTRLLERARLIPLRALATFVDDTGQAHTLKSYGGAPLAVILWSRNCGAALERVGEIQEMFTRLSQEGKQVVFVADEAPSPALRDVLRKRGWTQPVFYDSRGELTKALTSFGTPAFYVLDGSGRVRFNFAEEAADVIAQMDAVASEGGGH